jgi:tetratricopeptide (TPR) repeat protein
MTMNSPENPGTRWRLFFLVLFFASAGVLLFVFCSRELFESDTFMHIKTGQLILEQRHIPREDPFSDANAGKPWINHETLSQVVFYILYRLGGPPALVIYCTLMVFICFGSAVFAGAQFRYPLTLLGLLVLSIITASERFQARPEVHSMALMGVFLFVLERFRTGRNEGLIWLLAPLAVLWENLHGGTLLGIELVGAYLIGEGMAMLSNRFAGWPIEVMTAGKYKRLAAVFILVIIACMLNPWGPMTFVLASELKGHAFAMSNIVEWQRTYLLFRDFIPLPLQAYPWLLGITAVSFILNFRRLNLSHVFIFIGFVILSLLARRNIALLAIVAVPLSARNISWFWKLYLTPFMNRQESARPWLHRMKRFAWTASALTLIFITGWLTREVITDRYYIKNRYFCRFGYGLSSTIYPWGLFEFMDKIDLEGPGFNNHDLGGFLIFREFPRFKAFVDCRSSIFDQDFLDEYQEAVESRSGFRILASKYRFNFAAILHLAGDGESLAGIIYQDPQWVLIYLDQATALFIRNISPNRKLIERYELNLAEGDEPAFSIRNPTAFDQASMAKFFQTAGVIHRAEKYQEKAVEQMPHHAIFLDNLAKIRLLAGKYAEAIPPARKAIEIDPEFAEARMSLANAYFHLERFEDAIREYDRAIDVQGNNPLAHSNRGAALLKLGRERDALESFERALEVEPEHTMARFNRALTLERLNDPRAREAWKEYLFHLKKTGAPLNLIQEAKAHINGDASHF